MAFLDTIKSMNPFGKKDDFDLDKELASLTKDTGSSQDSSFNQSSFDLNPMNQNMAPENGQFQDQSVMSQDPYGVQNNQMNGMMDPMGDLQAQMPATPADPMNNQMQSQPLYQELPVDESNGQFPTSYAQQQDQPQPQFDPSGQVQMLTPAPLQDIDHKSIRMEKEIEVVQAKLDTLKAVLDSINQRLAHLEEQNRYKRNNW